MNRRAGERRALAAPGLLLALGAGVPGCSLVLDGSRYRALATPDDTGVGSDAPVVDVAIAADQVLDFGDGAMPDAAMPDATAVADGAAYDGGTTATLRWHAAPGFTPTADQFRAIAVIGGSPTHEVFVGGNHGSMLHGVSGRWMREMLPALDGVPAATWVVRSIAYSRPSGMDSGGTYVWAVCSVENPLLPVGAIMRRRIDDTTHTWRVFALLPFRPTGIQDAWPTAQYGAIVAEDGHLYLYDTGTTGVLYDNGWSGITPLAAISVGGVGSELVSGLWIVGRSPLALRFERSELPVVVVPDIALGATVEDVSVGLDEPIVHAAVSDAGTLAILENEVWHYVPSALIHAPLYGVYTAEGSRAVFAVGEGGKIIRSDVDATGRSWSYDVSSTTNTLFDVGGTAVDDVWAVGDLGTILHFGADD